MSACMETYKDCMETYTECVEPYADAQRLMYIPLYSASCTFRYVPYQEITGTMQLEPCNWNPAKIFVRKVLQKSVADTLSFRRMIDDGNYREMPPENKKDH